MGLHPDNNSIRVWRRTGERNHPSMTVERHQQFGGSILFWAGVMFGRRTPLVSIEENMTAAVYKNNILQPIVSGFAETLGEGFTLQDDNARPHRAHSVQRYLVEHGIRRMDWPACSLDMNCIEHAWSFLRRAISNRPHHPLTIQELRNAALEEWVNLPQESLDALVLSMPRHIQECLRIQAEGQPVVCVWSRGTDRRPPTFRVPEIGQRKTSVPAGNVKENWQVDFHKDSGDEDFKNSNRGQLQATAELVTELLVIVQPYNEERGIDIRKDSDLISNEIENSLPPTRRIKRERNKGSSTDSYPAFAHIGLREKPGKKTLNQVTCPDRDSNPGNLVSRPDALTVTPTGGMYGATEDSDYISERD
ncbi:hypothetical protein ANN_09340 [Periplaneta americana]|uniref:Tc1-like transposase DDE domain-containing protein n=1 Tax=Periplaneta americana TaxID=6978 RepID=A0ABQ8TMJ1_PERAM|nr:hypothetical protein ANN_09340 [Periplaneta americana]